MKTAKRWIVSAGACLLALTSMSVSFGQIPTAPIPEQNNDGLPLLTEPAPIDVAPIQAPPAPMNVPAPEIDAIPQTVAPAATPQQSAIPQTVAPAPAPQQYAAPQPAPSTQAAPTQQPCRQCMDPYQRCPAGAYYSPTPYYGQDSIPWWLHIRPVPYTPVEHGHGHHGMGHPGLPIGGRIGGDRLPRLAPVEPPFYSTRGPRDFYLDKPRPLGY